MGTKIKKLIATGLAVFLLTIGFLSACSNGSDNAQGVDKFATVWSALSTEKYMQDEEVEGKGGAEISFTGIKNETQSAQLMLTAKQKINSFDLKTDDLKQSDGTVFSKDNISVFAERYIDIYNPYLQDASYQSYSGFYPDALVPISRYQTRKEDKVLKGNNQGIWIDAVIAKDAKAGEYAGSFTLVVNGEEKSIPVTLKIYDLTMSDTVHSKSAFEIWYETIGFGEGNNMDGDTYETYYRFLLTKKLTSSRVPPEHSSSIEKFVEYITGLAADPQVTSYQIPLPPIDRDRLFPLEAGTYPDSAVEAEASGLKNNLKAQLKAIADKNLALRADGDAGIDLFKKAIYYFEDEPTVGVRTSRVKVFCEQLNNAKKELLADYADEFTAYPDLKASLESVDEICPSNYVNEALFVSEKDDGTPDYEKSDGLTLWCPEMYKFNETAFRNTVKERQQLGERFWWYLCVSNSPRPSYYVESVPMNIRLQSWMQYEYNIEGILYWQICHWADLENPYEDVIYNTYGGAEGILVYPGERYGMKTPLSSIRLEQIRMGQQDYEYFWMLEQALNADGGGISARDVVAALGKKLYSGTTLIKNNNERLFEESRIQILEILERFAEGKSDEAKAIINSIV